MYLLQHPNKENSISHSKQLTFKCTTCMHISHNNHYAFVKQQSIDHIKDKPVTLLTDTVQVNWL